VPPSWTTRIGREIAGCTACPRLARYVQGFTDEKGYWARPVPGFGDAAARILILGLAPGAHGANRTGRPFTGDGAGIFLYRALHEHGFASAPESLHRRDGLTLDGVFITNAVKCVPPQNKPTGAEAQICSDFLRRELDSLKSLRVILALGRIAHDNALRRARDLIPDLKLKDHVFAHGAVHTLPSPLPLLINTYHPSRYIVNTGRLTYEMFTKVVKQARRLAVSRRG